MLQKRYMIGFSTKFFIAIIGIVVIFMVMKELMDIFIPLVLAILIYFIFAPLNNYLAKKGFPRYVAIIVDFLILLIVLGGVSTVIIDSFVRFGQDLPKYEEKLNGIISSTAKSLGLKFPELLNFNIAESLKKVDYSLIAGSIFSSTFSVLEYSFLIVFYFIFIVTGQKDIYNAIKKRYMNSRKNSGENSDIDTDEDLQDSDKSGDKNENVMQLAEKEISENTGKPDSSYDLNKTFIEITTQIQKYVVSKFNISLVTGILEGFVLFLFGIDYFIVWAVFIFLFNFIPAIGSFIGIVLPCIMALVQYESFTYAFIIGGILVIMDNIIGNYVEPKFFGHQLGLSPIFILLSLLIWGYVWGIIGMILSVPITSIIKIAISRAKSPNIIFLSDLMSGESNKVG